MVLIFNPLLTFPLSRKFKVDNSDVIAIANYRYKEKVNYVKN